MPPACERPSNVFYLNGEPPDSLLNHIPDMSHDDGDIKEAERKFCRLLERHGRPAQGQVNKNFGYRLIDLLENNERNTGTIRRAPWLKVEGDSPIIEVTGYPEINGWWTEAADGVLLCVQKYQAITPRQIAKLLCESHYAPQELSDWIEANALTIPPDVVSALPLLLRRHLSTAFRTSERTIAIAIDRSTGTPLFDLVEQCHR